MASIVDFLKGAHYLHAVAIGGVVWVAATTLLGAEPCTAANASMATQIGLVTYMNVFGHSLPWSQ